MFSCYLISFALKIMFETDCKIAFIKIAPIKFNSSLACNDNKMPLTIELENSDFQHVNYQISIKSDFN